MVAGLDESVLKQIAIENWRKSSLNRPVKVTNVSRPPMFWSEGYITAYKFIAGRPLGEVERILGLPPGELAAGAYCYEFLRLPTADEFDLRGYTQTPGGQPYSPGGVYPAGAGAAQWEVRRNTQVPTRLFAIVAPGNAVP